MSDRIKRLRLDDGRRGVLGRSGCMGQYLFTREGMDSTWLVPIRLFLAGLILCGFFFIKDRKTLFDPWNVRKIRATPLTCWSTVWRASAAASSPTF